MNAVANAPTLPPATAPDRKAQVVVSPGGITAWLVEEYAVPLIAVDFAFIGGASHDAKGKAGTARMLASLLDEGAGKYDSSAFQEAMADKAIQIGFSASHDVVTGGMRTLSRYREDAFELLRLAVNEPRFDDEPIARIRAGLSAEIKSEASDPGTLASRLFAHSGISDHPYGIPVGGDLETVAAITREDIINARACSFARSNLRIAVVGAIDAKTLSGLLDHVFAALPASPQLATIPHVELTGMGRIVHQDLDIPQTYFRFGRPGIAWTDPDYAAAAVVDHILGGGSFTSRLWTEIRETRGLTYGIGTSVRPFLACSLQGGSTFTKNERARELYDVLMAEYARMAADGPSDTEVEEAKTYIAGSYPLGFDSSGKIANKMLNHAIYDLGIDYVDRYRAMIGAVTLEDARRVAKRLYGDGGLLICVVGRPQELPM
jgi:zinc protease